jgi:hypothetical protein
MKETLQSLVRHLLTFLAGLGTTLHAAGLLGAEDVAQVNEQGLTLQAVIAGVIVAILMRLVMTFSGKLVSAHVNDGRNDGGSLLLLLGMAGLLGLGLPSCSREQMQAVKAVPIKACYTDKNGNKACYSSKGGIEVDLNSPK